MMRRLAVVGLVWLALSMSGIVHAQIIVDSAEGPNVWLDPVSRMAVSTSGFYGLRYPTTAITDIWRLACASGIYAETCAIGSTAPILGPVAELYDSGEVNIVASGAGICQFDGDTVAGHYVQLSTSTAGQCVDAGATYPINGARVVGAVKLTTFGGGPYELTVFGPGPHVSTNDARAAVAADVVHAQSSTTLTNVTGLSFAACGSATEVWQVEVHMILTQSATVADFKWGWTYPTGATIRWGTTSANPLMDYWGATATTDSPLTARIETDTLATGSVGATYLLTLKAIVLCSTTAGTIQLVFAQQVSNASDNTVKRGSSLIARKVSH